MAKIKNPTTVVNPVLTDTIFVQSQQPADIILTNTEIELKGSKIKIFGATKNLLASFDSKTSKFTVHKKLIVKNIDVLDRLKALEIRIQKLES